MTANKLTQQIMRDASDELAVRNGCWFDGEDADHVCDFFENNLVLYEGEYAGKPFVLMDWQRDLLSRLFGWKRESKTYGRPVRRFSKASIWLPKKQGKSPLGAGIGLYLLVADGEQGQKVYSAAKDGKQAGIMHNHARQMVHRSPKLSKMCTINKSTGRIIFNATSSWYEILAADNVRSQEGLNGSVIIDETHVVDARLAKVLEYMGASRSEPLQVELSTVGNNPQGYGKRQWDYGKQVRDGQIEDDEFLYIAYAAPQDIDDEALENPDVWRYANPSMGHTINEDEFARSFKRAKRSKSDLATFKMYRLNIWQHAENPWLNVSDIKACRDTTLSLDSLAGAECYGGLDLSRTRDMSAFSLHFLDENTGEPDGILRTFHWFWLPSSRVEAMEGTVPVEEWIDAGWLQITSGNVIDYSAIEATISELAERFRLQTIAFDPRFAEELTQRLEINHGIERVAVPQSANHLSGPIDEYERRIISRTMRHDGNPIYEWQAGHAHLKNYHNGGKMVVKPPTGEVKTIDGVMADIFATSESMVVAENGAPAIY